MNRKSRPIIAIQKETGERRAYNCTTDCAKELGVSTMAILVAVSRTTSVKGWKLYDSPDNIRLRIQELEKQITMLEEEAH